MTGVTGVNGVGVSQPTQEENSEPELLGEHALVTGGSRGIGAAIAQELSSKGAAVTIVARDHAVAREAASALLGKAVAVAADVTQCDQVARAFKQSVQSLGPVSILINNVGAASTAPFLRTDEDAWQWMFDINVRPVRLCCAEALPAMFERGAGRIVNVASTAGLRGYPYVSAYVAAKHAVVGLTRALAEETAARGVGISAVCPGFVDTDMTRNSAADVAQRTGQSVEDVLASYAASNTHQRLVAPTEVAAEVAWLCCQDVSTTNGSVVTVDGSKLDRPLNR